MSLLSDLLAKVKHREQKRDVPPMLREDIVRSLQRQRTRRRWLLISMASLVTIIAGMVVALWLGIGRTPRLLSSQPLVQTMPKAPSVVGTPEEARPDRGQARSVAVGPPDEGRSTMVAQTDMASPNAATEPPRSRSASPEAPTTGSATTDAPSPQPGNASPEAQSGHVTATPGRNGGRPGDEVRGRPSGMKDDGAGVAVPHLSIQPNGGRTDGHEDRELPASSVRAQAERPIGQRDREGSSTDEVGRAHGERGGVTGQRVRPGLTDQSGGEGLRGQEEKRAMSGSSPEGMMVPVKTARWNRDVYLYQASTSEANGDLKQALVNYQKVLAMEPKNHLILNNIASILVRQGSNDEAICYAERAIAAKPNYVPAIINLSIAYLQKGNGSEGENCLRRALAIEATNRLALKNLAVLLERQDRLEEAQSVYARLAQLRDVQGYLGVARIAEKRDQKAEAVRAYQEARQLDGIGTAERALADDRITVLTQ